MIITKEMMNNKISKDMIPTRLDSAINLYVNIKDKGLVLYIVNPDTWNCLYPFYELNHKFTLDNYTISDSDITYKELMEEYQKYYNEIHVIGNGYTKEKRKEILINEYKKTFNINNVLINDEIEPYYEIKYSKTKNVWTLYYFENYVVSNIDNLNNLLEQQVYPQEFMKLDSSINKINGIDVVSSLPYILSIEDNLEILRKNELFIDDEFNKDERYIDIAIDISKKAKYPYGAIVVKNNEIIGRSDDTTLMESSMYSHPELEAIESASKNKNLYGDLKGATMYVSCEPCMMCMGAILYEEFSKIVYAATLQDSNDIYCPEMITRIDDLAKYSKDKIEIIKELHRDKAVEVLKMRGE